MLWEEGCSCFRLSYKSQEILWNCVRRTTVWTLLYRVFKVLRWFFDVRRQLGAQERLNKMWSNSCQLTDGSRICSHSDRLRSSVYTGFRHYSKTVAGGYKIVRQLQKSEPAPFLKQHTSHPLRLSVAEISEESGNGFCLSGAFLSNHIAKTSVFLRTYPTAHHRSAFAQHPSRAFTMSLFRRYLSVLACIRRQLGHFATISQSYLKSFIAPCAISQ